MVRSCKQFFVPFHCVDAVSRFDYCSQWVLGTIDHYGQKNFSLSTDEVISWLYSRASAWYCKTKISWIPFLRFICFRVDLVLLCLSNAFVNRCLYLGDNFSSKICVWCLNTLAVNVLDRFSRITHLSDVMHSRLCGLLTTQVPGSQGRQNNSIQNHIIPLMWFLADRCETALRWYVHV